MPTEESVADLGCDHALLAAALVEAGPSRRVIAADIAPGAVKMARVTRARFALGERLDIRHGDGISVLSPGEAVCVVIAGVGGRTLLDMLGVGGKRPAGGPPTRTLDGLGVTRLVLQPQAALGAVRTALHDAGWAFADECLVREAGHTYALLVATRPDGDTRGLADDLDAEFGPWIRHRPDPLFLRQLEEEAKRIEFLIRRLRSHQAPMERITAFEARRTIIENERTRVERPGPGS